MRECAAYMNDNYDSVPALVMAAHILADAGRFGLAQPLLKHASRLTRDSAYVWNNLGLCYQEGADWEEGEAHFFRALKLEPHNANTHNNLAQLYVSMAQFDRARKHANKAIDEDPGIAKAYFNRAVSNLGLREWKAGWADYDAPLGPGDTRKERIYGMVPRWNGIEGKTLIAYGEQGIGDEIIYASCIPDLVKQNKVIIECDPKLSGLFRRSFGLETHGTRFKDNIPWLHNQKTGVLRKIDGAVALGSLPSAMARAAGRHRPEDEGGDRVDGRQEEYRQASPVA
jgi:Flp pilus assembly protein TadD